MVTLARVRTVFTGVAGTPWYSNLYFHTDATTPDVQIDQVRDFWTALVSFIDNGVTATVEGDVSLLESTTGAITGISSGTALLVVGTATQQAMPPATQGVLHEFTSIFVGGRQLRGKTFLPGLTINAADANGAPVAAFKTAVLGAGNALITAANATGNWQVWSKHNLVSSDIVSISTPSKFGVLRSRRD